MWEANRGHHDNVGIKGGRERERDRCGTYEQMLTMFLRDHFWETIMST